MSADSKRLDNFTDAAFAFAVTLLVIGGAAPPESYGELTAATAKVPAFAMGFALIGMFWHAHVRWRRTFSVGDGLSVFLTFALVFLVLVYVYPLRIIAGMSVAWAMGDAAQMDAVMGRGSWRGLFTLYGLGFVLMSAVIAALFAHGRRRCRLDADTAMRVKVELGVWVVLVAVGLVSIAVAQVPAISMWAGMVYSTLPLLIPLWVYYATRPLKGNAAASI